LEFEYCDLGFIGVSGKANRSYLNKLELTLTLPWYLLLLFDKILNLEYYSLDLLLILEKK